MLELLKELKLEFKGLGAIHKIITLIEQGYIPIDCDVCVVNSKSIIDGRTSPTEYRFYVELANQVVNIEHHDVDLLMKLYRTLMLFKLK